MKFVVLSLSVLAVFALVESKGVPAEVVEAIAEDSRVKGEELVQSVVTHMKPDLERLAEEEIQVTFMSKSCTNSECLRICNWLGFSKGVCISTATCQCSN